jgi:rhamnose utilization protein RhaD (predicted bifunctional aldolase and dehydrogenase)
MCSNDAERFTKKIFGEKALFIPYTDPGIVLSKTVLKFLIHYRKINKSEPHYIFLQNHGVFVAAHTVEEIKSLYKDIESRLLEVIPEKIVIASETVPDQFVKYFEVIQDYLFENKYPVLRFNSLIQSFTKDKSSIQKITRPYIPDQIVYCKAYPLVILNADDNSFGKNQLHHLYKNYVRLYGYEPKVILFEHGPVVGIEENRKSSELVLDIFEDAMKISYYSHFFGGPHPMNRNQIEFIENWEAENYRRKVARG